MAKDYEGWDERGVSAYPRTGNEEESDRREGKPTPADLRCALGATACEPEQATVETQTVGANQPHQITFIVS